MQNQKIKLKKSYSPIINKKRILAGGALLLALLAWWFVQSQSDFIQRELTQSESTRESPTNSLQMTNKEKVQTPWSIETQQKIQILKEIFTSKNDNDPRLDSEFKQLTEEQKSALREEYKKLPMESLNERGTIVFLLGRTAQSLADFEFLDSVMNEPICMSLSNCEKDAESSVNVEDTHLESADNITLAYPQLVVLNMYALLLKQTDPMDTSFFEVVEKSIYTAAESQHHEISKKAKNLINLLKQKKSGV